MASESYPRARRKSVTITEDSSDDSWSYIAMKRFSGWPSGICTFANHQIVTPKRHCAGDAGVECLQQWDTSRRLFP
jgi:hypothetical protein